ncbi:hypothetical protein BV898_06664 [Hypsibius exemplaris]|uniref:Uncharacterized protein n=1 Tax=Hypsibius exemplaris TaxID=2072580 RepID=A0A1W0WVK3_HYPEX|nr:hypothetical protein BV898_06664 [Hypsibius exemplaris]
MALAPTLSSTKQNPVAPIEDAIYNAFNVPPQYRLYEPKGGKAVRVQVQPQQLVGKETTKRKANARPRGTRIPSHGPPTIARQTKTVPGSQTTATPPLSGDSVQTKQAVRFEDPTTTTRLEQSTNLNVFEHSSNLQFSPKSSSHMEAYQPKSSHSQLQPSSATPNDASSGTGSNRTVSPSPDSRQNRKSLTPAATHLNDEKSHLKQQITKKRPPIPQKTQSEEDEAYWTTTVTPDDWLDITVSEWCEIADEIDGKVPSTPPTLSLTRCVKKVQLDRPTKPDDIFLPEMKEDTLATCLDKADSAALDEIAKVYLPAFESDPKLQVDSDAYYDSEPDTLSCCSDPPDAVQEDRMEQTAWDVQFPAIFEMVRMNAGHLTEYALINRNTLHFIALSRGLVVYKEELNRLMRCLSELAGGMSGLTQSSRQTYIPFGRKVYLTTRLDRTAVYARTTDHEYDGFVARPVAGLWVFGFYDSHCHPAVTVDVVNSVVDYINFSVFACLPEYEDGFEEKINTVLDDDDEDGGGKRRRKSRHDKAAFTSQDIFALPL